MNIKEELNLIRNEKSKLENKNKELINEKSE